jgi:outer membrane lipoprotein-sorting protein
MTSFLRPILLLPLAAMMIGGCAAHPKPEANLPTFAAVDHDAALRILDQRARAVKSLSARSLLTLTRPDGQTVRLDGAVVMAPPDRLRLRAWKFNQAIFDLTLTPDGLWVVAPDDPSRREKVLPASLSAAQLGREWALLSGSFFGDPGLTARDVGDKLAVSKSLEDGRTVVCDVDRKTLTPRRYRMFDPAGRVRFTLTLGEYGVFNGIAWPTRLDARSDEGRINVRLSDVELNGDLAPNAFKPPRRAEKQS